MSVLEDNPIAVVILGCGAAVIIFYIVHEILALRKCQQPVVESGTCDFGYDIHNGKLHSIRSKGKPSLNVLIEKK